MSLDWSACRNGRDLGGLPTTDGGRIRAGALWRTGHHDQLPVATAQAARDGGVSRVVDLRWSWEIERRPSPFAGDPVYRHVPMVNDLIDYVPPPDSYAPMLDHNRERIGAAVRAVAEAPPGPVVVHCHAGRDRTGVLVALLLRLAGVDNGLIADDYARTEGCSPQPMLHTLAHLDERYGGVEPYLILTGTDHRLQQAVRHRLR